MHVLDGAGPGLRTHFFLFFGDFFFQKKNEFYATFGASFSRPDSGPQKWSRANIFLINGLFSGPIFWSVFRDRKISNFQFCRGFFSDPGGECCVAMVAFFASKQEIGEAFIANI